MSSVSKKWQRISRAEWKQKREFLSNFRRLQTLELKSMTKWGEKELSMPISFEHAHFLSGWDLVKLLDYQRDILGMQSKPFDLHFHQRRTSIWADVKWKLFKFQTTHVGVVVQDEIFEKSRMLRVWGAAVGGNVNLAFGLKIRARKRKIISPKYFRYLSLPWLQHTLNISRRFSSFCWQNVSPGLAKVDDWVKMYSRLEVSLLFPTLAEILVMSLGLR